MLIQFTVENFMSFKEQTVFSMSPGIDSEHEDNVFNDGSYKALRSAAVYGANASGKSNIMRAFTTVILMLRVSNDMQINQPLGWISPFAFDNKTSEEPSSFEIIFTVDSTKYVYGFSAKIDKIVDEYLYVYNSQKPTTIFEREDTEKYSFPGKDKKELEEIKEKNTQNKLFLATATSWNYEKTREAFLWLTECIDTYDHNAWQNPSFDMYANDEAGEVRTFTKRMLKMADISVADYELQEIAIPKKQLKQLVPSPIYSEMIKSINAGQSVKGYNLLTKHKVKGAEGEEEYVFDFQQESLGTQRLFAMAPHFKHAFDRGKTMVIDEIESSLHPLLVEAIIDLFNDPDINRNNAQLIFTTHDINVLSLDIFRRDQIFFTEKDNDTGISNLFSLDEINIRKDERIGKRYIQGRYGAIPMIDRGVNFWD